MVLQTCIITLSNRFNWGKINLKFYFTTKPNEHLQALAYTSVFFYQMQWYIINNETKRVYFIYLPGTGSLFIEITKYIIRSVIHLILIHKRNFWNRMDVQGIITIVVCERERERNWAEIEWRVLRTFSLLSIKMFQAQFIYLENILQNPNFKTARSCYTWSILNEVIKSLIIYSINSDESWFTILNIHLIKN